MVQAYVDVGFWGGAVPDNLADLEPLHEAGVFGFKCFLLPSGVDEFPELDAVGLANALEETGRLGALLIAHAEDASGGHRRRRARLRRLRRLAAAERRAHRPSSG